MNRFPAPEGMKRNIPLMAYWADALTVYPGGEYIMVMVWSDYMEAVADLPAAERVQVQATDAYRGRPVLVGDFTGLARIRDA